MQEKTSTNVHFGAALTRVLDKKALNDAQLARAVGCTPTAIGNYKNGRVPRAEELYRIARFFSVSMESLLTGTAQPSADDGSWKLRALTAEQRTEDLKSAMLQVVKKF
jgi:transcriptional regulator with XRE-family HTH domain